MPVLSGPCYLTDEPTGEPIRLKLCECERATGPPNGLGCDKEVRRQQAGTLFLTRCDASDVCPTTHQPAPVRPSPCPSPSTSKQGWFISSFERQGQWVAGGGYVPLSHAICCRPCLPGELPPDPSGRIPGGAKPLAIISLGCHSSTDVLSTRCELEAGSFVSGYSEAVKVFTTVGAVAERTHSGWGDELAWVWGGLQPVWPPRCRLRTSAAPACVHAHTFPSTASPPLLAA